MHYLRDGGSSAQSVASWVLNDRELIRVGLPDVLCAIVVLGCDDDLVSHEECRVEADSELANEVRGGLAFRLHLCHLVEELAGARFSNSTQVPHKFLFGHANASVSDVQHVLLLVRLKKKKFGGRFLLIYWHNCTGTTDIMLNFISGLSTVKDALTIYFTLSKSIKFGLLCNAKYCQMPQHHSQVSVLKALQLLQNSDGPKNTP